MIDTTKSLGSGLRAQSGEGKPHWQWERHHYAGVRVTVTEHLRVVLTDTAGAAQRLIWFQFSTQNRDGSDRITGRRMQIKFAETES